MIRARRSTIGTRVLVLPKAANAPAPAAVEGETASEDDAAVPPPLSSRHLRADSKKEAKLLHRRTSSQSLSDRSSQERSSSGPDGSATDASSVRTHGSGGTDGIRSTKFFRFLRSFDPGRYEQVGFFETLENLGEGDIVLFRTKRITSRIQRAFVKSGGFDHLGIVVLCDDCDDRTCCSPELKQARAAAGVPPWHTLEADSAGVSVFRFTPHCLGAYKGIVAVRHLHLDEDVFPPDRLKEMAQTLNAFVAEMKGRPYEQNIFQMLRAANLFGHNNEEDLTSVFCSELVAAAYNRMGLLEKPHQRPSNAYIPGDFASKNAGQARAVKLVSGATLSCEKILNTSNMRVASAEPASKILSTISAPPESSSHANDAASAPANTPLPSNGSSLALSGLLAAGSSSSSSSSLSASLAKHPLAQDRTATAAAIEQKLLEVLGPSSLDDRPHVSRSPRGGSGLLSSSKRMVRLESEGSSAIKDAEETKNGVQEPLKPDQFRKIMVLERLKHEKHAARRLSLARGTSVREGDAPIRLEDLNASAIVEELAKADQPRMASKPPLCQSTSQDDGEKKSTDISRETNAPVEGLALSRKESSEANLSDRKVDKRDIIISGYDIEPGKEPEDGDREEPEEAEHKNPQSGEREAGPSWIADQRDNRPVANSSSSASLSSVPNASKAQVADALPESTPSAGAAWSDLSDDGNGVASDYVSEDLTLSEGSTHLQYVCAAQAAWLNINFTIAPPSGSSFRGNEEYGANTKVDFVLRGPLPSDSNLLLDDDDPRAPHEPSEGEKGRLLFATVATTSNDVILDTPALPHPGWYELEWNNEGEKDVQLTLLCFIQGRDRALTPIQTVE
ncbi:Hypothetical Protein FCC1311_107022 [Hondaea fermentalgiana]|uniref:Uncharacterized protein n=1 Tax=Hondaea fermentalgiana TaxID=2315210 RepID=A0A2R5GXG6_9STRA|nr:Hypothetical Protein FCC1311_107022 [Hondaea fermentalgiana]|eukprot:GBG34478.1 Hypothetical Protein FCC1311_107022 [Hondaea fermentalgiana]